MSTNPKVVAAADRLRKAAAERNSCDPIRDLIGENDLQTAYEVQVLNNKNRRAAGARVVGSKIGLTSLAVQKQFGISAPDYGLLFDDMEVLNGSEISIGQLMQPRVEAEIAFVLGKDLNSAWINAADMISAVDYALASIEIVGSRIRNWDIRITDTIADNASASHFVLGHLPVNLQNIDLINCVMDMKINGESASKGRGGDCMGSPINACLWLAKTMAEHGTPLRAGQIILSGALGPMANVTSGDTVEAVIEGLGGVSVHFTE